MISQNPRLGRSAQARTIALHFTTESDGVEGEAPPEPSLGFRASKQGPLRLAAEVIQRMRTSRPVRADV